MEEENKGKAWLIWVLLPVCVAGTIMATRWVIKNGNSAPQPGLTEEYTGGQADETAAARQAREAAEAQYAPSAEPPAQTQNQPAVHQYKPVALPVDPVERTAARPQEKPGKTAAANIRPAAPEADADSSVDPEKDASFGSTYGAISAAVGKMINNPRAISAMLNNGYVVKGFMSRGTVRAATANKAALISYLKNPQNLNKFMIKPAVQAGLNNQAVFAAVASSKLVGALMDTPGGKALLKDPAALAGILKANPGLADVLTNPAILSALMQNPQTAGIATNLNMGGLLR